MITEIDFKKCTVNESQSSIAYALAKQLAIDFAIWINKHPLQFQTTVSDTWIGLDLIYYTTEELFELFLNSTPNGK